MRYTFTCWLFFLSLLAARAQMHKSLLFNGKGWPGTYVLNADRRTPHTGQLRVYARTLVVHTDQGQTLRYRPEEVYRVRIGRVRYTTARGFKAKTGLWSSRQAQPLFVEVLDSGQISLLRYLHYVGGHDNTATTTVATYMLAAAPADSVVTLPVSDRTGQGKRFQEVLMPYIVSRPDLLQLVKYGAITIDTLPALLHAFNSGEPFPFSTVGLPPRHLEEVRQAPAGN